MSNPKDILQRIDSEAMTREDIAAALSSVSKDAFLDHELQRLGFWDPNNLNETERSIANLEEKCDVLRARLVELQSDQSKKADAQKRLEAKKKKDKDEAFAKRKAKHESSVDQRILILDPEKCKPNSAAYALHRVYLIRLQVIILRRHF